MKQKSEFDARRYVQLFMAGYVPRSKDEKKFVDKHVAQLHQDVNGNKDDVFKATNIPTHKRPPYHGYEKGQDERMYEEVEPIQEVSKDKLFRYITSATADLRLKSHKAGIDALKHPSTPEGMSDLEKRNKRQRGIGTAAKKLAYGKVSEEKVKMDPYLEPVDQEEIKKSSVISDHEGKDGHRAEVRYRKDVDLYSVHHYLDDQHMGSSNITFHDTKKDAEATARYTTSTRNSDYTSPKKQPTLDQAMKDLKKPRKWYGVEPKRSIDSNDRAFPEVADGRGVREDVNLDEEMTDAQMAKRERIVKSMKKKSGTFEKRYGDKAKDVMYATATKMAMEDLDYVNLEMTDAVADLLESQHNLVGKQKNIDKNNNGKIDGEDLEMLRNQKSMKHMETQAKKVREITKKYPIAQRDESVIEQILGKIGTEETVEIEFNSGEVVEITSELAESIINVFMDLTEENQIKFEELISEDLVGFEDGLSFIAEAFEGNE